MFENGKAFDLVNDRINLRLSAVRVLPIEDNSIVAAFEIIPHVG